MIYMLSTEMCSETAKCGSAAPYMTLYGSPPSTKLIVVRWRAGGIGASGYFSEQYIPRPSALFYYIIRLSYLSVLRGVRALTPKPGSLAPSAKVLS